MGRDYLIHASFTTPPSGNLCGSFRPSKRESQELEQSGTQIQVEKEIRVYHNLFVFYGFRMTNEVKSFRDILRAEFQNRLSKDPHYRLLDFAKDLATPISRMSEIMSGRSGISTQRALHYADSLLLSPDAKTQFLKLVSNECSRTKWTRKSANTEIPGESQHGPKLFFKTYTVPQEKKEAFIEFLKSSLDQWAENNLNGQTTGGITTVEAFEQKMN